MLIELYRRGFKRKW